MKYPVAPVQSDPIVFADGEANGITTGVVSPAVPTPAEVA